MRSEDWFSSEEGRTPARRVLGLKGRPLSASQTPGRSSPAATVRAGAETGEAGRLCVCLLSRGRGPGTDGQALPQRSAVTGGELKSKQNFRNEPAAELVSHFLQTHRRWPVLFKDTPAPCRHSWITSPAERPARPCRGLGGCLPSPETRPAGQPRTDGRKTHPRSVA